MIPSFDACVYGHSDSKKWVYGHTSDVYGRTSESTDTLNLASRLWMGVPGNLRISLRTDSGYGLRSAQAVFIVIRPRISDKGCNPRIGWV